MVESNTIVRACTLYRQLQQYFSPHRHGIYICKLVELCSRIQVFGGIYCEANRHVVRSLFGRVQKRYTGRA